MAGGLQQIIPMQSNTCKLLACQPSDLSAILYLFVEEQSLGAELF